MYTYLRIVLLNSNINFLKLQIKVIYFIRVRLERNTYILEQYNTKKDRMIVLPFFLTCKTFSKSLETVLNCTK